MKNLLVTGGCGFIGANFIHYILRESDFSGRVINVDKLTYAGNPMSLAEIEKEYLTIKVSRGIDGENALQARLKIGEGIAGIAADENTSFVISGEQSDNRIKQLLKRPDIKQSVVIPLSSQDRVFGVLNLHTKCEEKKIGINENKNLQNLSKLISTVIYSI